MTWEHPDELDAVVAAPTSHRIVFENEDVRVLEVTVAPGVHEPEHTHRWPSVMSPTSAPGSTTSPATS
jgi:hypothetical protein